MTLYIYLKLRHPSLWLYLDCVPQMYNEAPDLFPGAEHLVGYVLFTQAFTHCTSTFDCLLHTNHKKENATN